ncbi:MAG: VWA domain-containing protein [Gammaproteobacteria bacterium]|nr:VWA domain-containing protein [Gammaproteobacteria bacterium]NIM73173.1 VWA domain-containing protein [Gammaproteobacteria bacterium]NIN40009.1 VWA domain-containing protein [Gammaproteobacteria bacterium]NIO26223.1 VWA domain-containing protein [Gammaproteobacteria bacterium]NIO66032.1 VWA domain-containing protein [Gammaproteobacteria bacterium]
MTSKSDKLPAKSNKAEIDAFLAKVASTPLVKASGTRGRLIFAMDATASREPTWDRACHIQSEMFLETESLGGLDVQLCYYRGFREFHASQWLGSSADLLAQMRDVRCSGGMTQIERVLKHTVAESQREKVNALVFVGDCMEENIDVLCQVAGELGILGVPAFMFHEGDDAAAERTFREIARLSGGAYCRFDASSAQQLRDLLSAVAVYAAGGRKALENFGRRQGGVALRLTQQLKKD